MLGEYESTPEEAMNDIMGLLFAGLDTTSHALVSCIYFIKKNPQNYSKLIEEIGKAGITKDMDYSLQESKDKIHSCDYLNFVVKEVLRIDPPGQFTLNYEVLEDSEICNVPIQKGKFLQI